jgi:hypothetical protein
MATPTPYEDTELGRAGRVFVGAVAGALQADAYPYYMDSSASNYPGLYNGIGTPLPRPAVAAVTPGGGVVLSPNVVLIAIGVCAAMLWKR